MIQSHEDVLPKEWEVVIGLEVHAQVFAQTKLFSPSWVHAGDAPNRNVHLIDAAMPGMLPVLNQHCVDQAVRTGLALNARINQRSIFARKNYFYPDLPQGYQISQYQHPIVGEGKVEIVTKDGVQHTIGITRLHLEQDAGKLLHDQMPRSSLVDLNRCGSALMEIVTEPDMRTAEQAVIFVQQLRHLLIWIGTCDGNMQDGSLRMDVNISIKRRDTNTLGTRTEIKNLNSFKFMRQAIGIEAMRQFMLIERGEEVIQQTRLFDPDRGETRPLRQKEDAQDYRYFPEPDLPPLDISQETIEQIRQSLPEVPSVRKKRIMDAWGISEDNATMVVSDRSVADYLETAINSVDGEYAVALTTWLVTDLFAEWSKQDQTALTSKISAQDFAVLVVKVASKKITARSGKSALALMVGEGISCDDALEKLGVGAMMDDNAIVTIISAVIKDNPSQVEQYHQGKHAILMWLVGQVMRQSKGQAQPSDIRALLLDRLGTSESDQEKGS